jgi:hypothetical protein
MYTYLLHARLHVHILGVPVCGARAACTLCACLRVSLFVIVHVRNTRMPV